MNYLKIYNDLVAHRKQNPAKGYTENHHIVMRSMGGSDTADNLVRLTGREHWVAHLLLYKIHRNSQTIHACNMMAMRCEERGIAYIKNSRTYEKIRIQHAKLISDRHKILQKGEGNSQYGTKWICNLDLKQNKKISKDDSIPIGWITGRNKWNPKPKKQKKARLLSGKTLKQQALHERQTKTYLIDNLVFFGLKEVCNYYNLSHPAVLYRIKSLNFPSWRIKSGSESSGEDT